jgi:hypothetical protein
MWSKQLNVLELFLDCITEPNEKLVEFGIGGICNSCVGKSNKVYLLLELEILLTENIRLQRLFALHIYSLLFHAIIIIIIIIIFLFLNSCVQIQQMLLSSLSPEAYPSLSNVYQAQ